MIWYYFICNDYNTEYEYYTPDIKYYFTYLYHGDQDIYNLELRQINDELTKEFTQHDNNKLYYRFIRNV